MCNDFHKFREIEVVKVPEFTVPELTFNEFELIDKLEDVAKDLIETELKNYRRKVAKDFGDKNSNFEYGNSTFGYTTEKRRGELSKARNGKKSGSVRGVENSLTRVPGRGCERPRTRDRSTTRQKSNAMRSTVKGGNNKKEEISSRQQRPGTNSASIGEATRNSITNA